jgi:hypothetical protein
VPVLVDLPLPAVALCTALLMGTEWGRGRLPLLSRLVNPVTTTVASATTGTITIARRFTPYRQSEFEQ